MFKESAPRDYVTGKYLEYQKKYSDRIRESDRTLIEWIGDTLKESAQAGKQLHMLDIGCSSGNFLRHCRKAFPLMAYHGADLFPEIIDYCRRDPELSGIAFDVMDIRALNRQEAFDVVVANAVLFRFEISEFRLAISSISEAMNRGGWFFTFELFHPASQEITIFEKSQEHPEGLSLIFHPYSTVVDVLKDSGFVDIEFKPFLIPIDLEKPEDPADLTTYTIKTDEGKRLNFRGSLYLPWCHMRARKLNG